MSNEAPLRRSSPIRRVTVATALHPPESSSCSGSIRPALPTNATKTRFP